MKAQATVDAALAQMSRSGHGCGRKSNQDTVPALSEGMVKKGGINREPQTPKQRIQPPPQKPEKAEKEKESWAEVVRAAIGAKAKGVWAKPDAVRDWEEVAVAEVKKTCNNCAGKDECLDSFNATPICDSWAAKPEKSAKIARATRSMTETFETLSDQWRRDVILTYSYEHHWFIATVLGIYGLGTGSTPDEALANLVEDIEERSDGRTG